jgi:hypothetical protein
MEVPNRTMAGVVDIALAVAGTHRGQRGLDGVIALDLLVDLALEGQTEGNPVRRLEERAEIVAHAPAIALHVHLQVRIHIGRPGRNGLNSSNSTIRPACRRPTTVVQHLDGNGRIDVEALDGGLWQL